MRNLGNMKWFEKTKLLEIICKIVGETRRRIIRTDTTRLAGEMPEKRIGKKKIRNSKYPIPSRAGTAFK